jgi:hypothetical protein
MSCDTTLRLSTERPARRCEGSVKYSAGSSLRLVSCTKAAQRKHKAWRSGVKPPTRFLYKGCPTKTQRVKPPTRFLYRGGPTKTQSIGGVGTSLRPASCTKAARRKHKAWRSGVKPPTRFLYKGGPTNTQRMAERGQHSNSHPARPRTGNESEAGPHSATLCVFVGPPLERKRVGGLTPLTQGHDRSSEATQHTNNVTTPARTPTWHQSKNMAISWQEHGKNMARTWQGHGKTIAKPWQEPGEKHGKSMAKPWQEHGTSMTEHGKSMAIAWQAHVKSMTRALQEHCKSIARAWQ